MAVHSFHIFDRKGKTLFTKRYIRGGSTTDDEEQLSEQRKLVFGMLFSLRELSASLSPAEGPGDLHLVKTGASTLYNYETVSGLRFCLYMTPEASYNPNAQQNMPSNAPNAPSTGGVGGGGPGGSSGAGMTNTAVAANVRGALKHIYEHIWVTFVVRSPMYRPNDPNISSTNFEPSLDNYLKGMSWYRS
mmetsp:Transcript_34233/g.53516  ORF Transcript_34233/g.53516 Transcript_34233/m.53516 type:complete len:189 (-) Transcript_34233:120-686(-)|eukprot:CAMPEP_0117020384 /NCGR_PEP_ID=MMETSP0472-20121206/15509_1 /TAXON_ID=693140 ORGANISM="Tiarina fusus, Strain LIS" /NCGR_SAMPLE_ID=MMETSP0472 /ASSEMBLY_ACC=CAM_ASM_000603 /LENGTH=188 /DNA_ID=CAMNT_0004725589 /DNA_START=91 /DNA_END=657 /DNA_ORIENTATION=+